MKSRIKIKDDKKDDFQDIYRRWTLCFDALRSIKLRRRVNLSGDEPRIGINPDLFFVRTALIGKAIISIYEATKDCEVSLDEQSNETLKKVRIYRNKYVAHSDLGYYNDKNKPEKDSIWETEIGWIWKYKGILGVNPINKKLNDRKFIEDLTNLACVCEIEFNKLFDDTETKKTIDALITELDEEESSRREHS